jgi:signal transduction histidine kinase
MASLLAILIGQTIRSSGIEALQSDYNALANGEARQFTETIDIRLSVLDLRGLAQNRIVVDGVKSQNRAAEAGGASFEGTNAEVQEEIELFLLSRPYFVLILVTNRDGILVASSYDTDKVNYGSESWHSHTLGGLESGFYLGDDSRSMPLEDSLGMVEVALPIADNDGKLIGAVYALWDIANDSQVVPPLVGTSSPRVTLLDADGIVLADTDREVVGQMIFDSQLITQIQDQRSGAVSGAVVRRDEHGTRRIIGYSAVVRHAAFEQLLILGELDWTVIVSQDLNVALVSSRVLIQRILIILILGTLALLGGSFFFTRLLIAPVNKLTDAARRIGKGELETPIPDLGEDEIGQLADVLRDTVTELISARNEAETANEAKSTFLANVSHELRTPLTSILGFAIVVQNWLSDRIFPSVESDDPKVLSAMANTKENINIIVTEGERLTTLINNVLDLAKIEAGEVEWNMQPLALAEIINRAVAATASLFERTDLEMIQDVPQDLPEIVGDRDALIQVMINLISNAVKFTEEGHVVCRATVDGDKVVLSIQDTGIGISNADQAHVFRRFRQVGNILTDKPKGTGLGLPICKEIVERHGGHIWVESKPGIGSTFSFSLPVSYHVAVNPGSPKASLA